MANHNGRDNGSRPRRYGQDDKDRLERQQAPETIDWQNTVSECSERFKAFKNDGGFEGLPTGEISDRITFRSELVEPLRNDRNLTRSEAEDVVDHAVHLGLLGTSPGGAFVYIPDKEVRADGLW